MRLTRLRLLGFKSFVEPSDFLIEPGLTGVVGPNGCGKSNLVEALRWVMGESSHKNLRAAEMDDVIFAGSGGRPGRNSAEVMLTVDNSDRTAPASFNDADVLEISRRIEREKGSQYRINGREVRARDVQLIFADASTGARSPALVRQGQIAELIAAKPQSRRRILEEAAGISGLHSRRHEAELRLQAAEQNLARLEDVLAQIEAQLEALKRQSRQAARYRVLTAEIRKAEALLFHIAFEEAGREIIEAEKRLDLDVRTVAERTRAQAEAARLAAVAAHDLQPLRDKEVAAAAALQRLNLAREALDQEERRAADRLAELDRRIAQGEADIGREKTLIADAGVMLERLDEEEAQLTREADAAGDQSEAAAARLVAGEAALATGESAMGEAQGALAEAQAQRGQAERSLREAAERRARAEVQIAEIERERQALAAQAGEPGAIEELGAALEATQEAQEEAEALTLAAEGGHARAREAEAASRVPLQEAERLASRLETEVGTLSKLLLAPGGTQYPPVADAIRVARGYETALGAALGDDLDAPADARAPARWAGAEAGAEDGPLPEGAEPLIDFVEAPPALHRRLAQIGVVARTDGPRLAPLLRPGQRLVSREGDFWRWDGFVAAANAPSAAARRLVEKNRLADLEEQAQAAREAVEPARAAAEAAQAALRQAGEQERARREAWRMAGRAADQAREALAAAERRAAQVASRLSAITEAKARLVAGAEEAAAAREEAEARLEALPDATTLGAHLAELRAEVAQRRAEAGEARAAVQSLARERDLRDKRLAAIAAERSSWSRRQSGGAAQIDTLIARQEELRAEREELEDAPAAFGARRRALIGEAEAAEAARKAAADRLAEAETRLADADRQGREALAALGKAREDQARAEERLEALRARRAGIVRSIAEALDVAPAAVLKIAGLTPQDPLPPREQVEKTLDLARHDRERLGAVNLRAEEEQREVQAQFDGLVAERDDLVEAIKRLRQAIANLNREGRERLLAAFDVVNGHFQRLFGTLFGGGTAELQFTESDDPLEAGLEMLARPPGKKPQTLSLLSGGEQALTAMALIFAVFLTNPAPICVLDEVDAPLDDANVERFCDLLDEMIRQTETRFVTITHNPITMARMNRLFGVTMAERGVSQLVSVDLQQAERIREAS
ncbi:chromosome segregation protein SMC [Labrys wisconsinensis]|uniref:Chromosome partition protein Smc n=1 Tax=Labrys wisconsinensis TaxID=425677 RepID=A0ABU0J895_9HYPH|nr:chromosome segregation protein SMC [Labrys wisconsinensis]MDQ0470502.1 chromosome segregation protein [Labrys wisconsinensis]